MKWLLTVIGAGQKWTKSTQVLIDQRSLCYYIGWFPEAELKLIDTCNDGYGFWTRDI